MTRTLAVILLLATPTFAQHPWIQIQRPVAGVPTTWNHPPPDPEWKDLRWPAAVAIAGSAADLATTQAAINSGKFKESNFLLGQNTAVRVGVSSALTVGVIVGSLKLHETHPRLARWILFGYGIARGVIATTTLIRIARQ